MATIRQVAARAGVSAMTVSNVLHGVAGACNEATRQRVLAAVEELHYRANALPKAMRSGTFDVVALVVGVSGSGYWLPPSMVDAIHDALAAAGKHLLLCKVDEKRLATDGLDRAPRLVRETHADGILVNGTSEESVARLAAALGQYPAVFINQRFPHDAVHPDDRAASATAYAYLRRRGATRLAYASLYGDLAGDVHGHSSQHDRNQGFMEAAAADGCPVAEVSRPATPTPTQEVALVAMADRVLDLGADGVCCYSELEAGMLCQRALHRGLDPSRLHLVAFSEAPFSFGSWQVATLQLPMAEIGRRSVAMLLQRIAGAKSCPSEELPVPLIEPPWGGLP